MNIFKVYAQLSVSKYDNQLSQTKFTVVREAIKQIMEKNPTNLLDFWPKVYNNRDAAGTYHFKEISLAVLNMLVIPTCNACVYQNKV